jgi:hypothetical protein
VRIGDCGDERSTTGGTTLLAVPVGEERTLVGNAVDVGRFVTHHALVISADVPVADVIAPENQDVGFRLLG